MKSDKEDNTLNKIVYEEIVSEGKDEFYDTFDEFMTFSNTPLNNETGLQQLVLLPKIEHKKYIVNKLINVCLTHDNAGKKNKPITFFKCNHNKFKR